MKRNVFGYGCAVATARQKVLTRREARELDAAERNIREARLAWARTVRRLGIAACARELGITPQALAQRLATVERFAEESSGRRKR